MKSVLQIQIINEVFKIRRKKHNSSYNIHKIPLILSSYKNILTEALIVFLRYLHCNELVNAYNNSIVITSSSVVQKPFINIYCTRK